MISLIYEQRAISVYFEFLLKLGSSNFAEQTSVISKILPLFKNEQILLLGDREFCSVKLANWLIEKEVCGEKLPSGVGGGSFPHQTRAPATLRQKVQFCLRLKKNEFIAREN